MIPKPYFVIKTHHQFGKTRTKIECPWCETQFWAYNWSMAGSGKRCPGCGSLHGMYLGAQEPPRKGTGK